MPDLRTAAVSRLTSKGRSALPTSSFGLPGSRKYPMPDRSHAADAKARASQQAAKGNLSRSAEAKIDAKANRVLGQSKGSSPMAKKHSSGGKRELPAALKAHEFKKGGNKPSGDLAKGKPPAKHHAKAEGAPSFHDHVVKKFGGGHNPGRGK